jgi:hypothetical protein
MRGYGDGGSRGGRGGGRGKIPCQVCGKTGHSNLRCYKRFDANYNGEEKYANATTTRYNVDTEWYMDTGATVHITSELDKLKTSEKYGGGDQVHTASNSGMPIRHIGQSTISSRGRNLILKDILHVPTVSKNLISVHKFTHDNNAFFEIHPWYFFLRIGTRGNFFWKENVGMVYILYLLQHGRHNSTHQIKVFSLPLGPLWHDGIIG